MRFRYGYVASMIRDALGAAEGARLRKSRRAPRNERCCLIVTKSRKCRVFAGKIMVQPDIKFSLIQPSNGHIGIVGARRQISPCALRIELNHRMADRVEHVHRNLVAILSAAALGAVRVCWNRIPRPVAPKRHETADWIHKVRECRRPARLPQRVQRKIAIHHRLSGN